MCSRLVLGENLSKKDSRTQGLKDILSKAISASRDALYEKLCTFPSNIFIYGAGGSGGLTLNLLQKYSLTPCAFLDHNAEQIKQKDGIPVLLPSSSSLIEGTLKEKALVLLAVYLQEKERNGIMNDLKVLGYGNVIDAQEIHALAFNFSDGADRTWSGNEDNIIRTLNLMADEESVVTYITNVSAHALRDYHNCPETNETFTYFLKHVPFSKGFSRFVDCGAYVGDTMKILLENYSPIDAYVGFEPFLPLYEKLTLQTKQMAEQIKCCLLVPCAVGNRNAVTDLYIGEAGSSKVVDNGDIKIPVVKIDDVLKVFAPTFIKMDIEGAEYEALLGARDTIARYKPDLAICVYHAINHIWDIPLLIDSWNLGYKFYLRAHSSATIETVLYAVCD